MSYTAHSIGDKSFIALVGDCVPPSTQVEIIARPGVEGHAFFDTNRRGEPFELTSYEDCATLSTAHARFREYQSMKGGPAVAVVMDDIDFSVSEHWKAVVIDVKKDVRAIQTPVGKQITANAAALLTAVWTLVAIPT